MNNYILVNKKPVECKNISECGVWMQKNGRNILKTYRDNMLISTVFLGMDHSYITGEIILFETMVFINDNEDYCNRYSTYQLPNN